MKLLSAFFRSIFNKPIEVDWSKDRSAYDWRTLAYKCFNKNQYSDALRCCDLSLRKDPKDFFVWALKGRCLYIFQSFEEAISCFDNALNHNSYEPDYYFMKGVCYIKLNKFHDANYVFSIALEKDTQNEYYWIWTYRGEMLSKNGKFSEALECYNKAIEYYIEKGRPASSRYKYIYTIITKAEALLNLGQLSEAKKCITEVNAKSSVPSELSMFWLLTKAKIEESTERKQVAIKSYETFLDVSTKYKMENDAVKNAKTFLMILTFRPNPPIEYVKNRLLVLENE